MQNEAPIYNLKGSIAPKHQKSPPNNKISPTYVLPFLVMNCQRALTHHQKEVAEATISNAPNLLARHEAHQACPPKADHEPPERS